MAKIGNTELNASNIGRFILMLARVLLGAWMIVNGLNHFVDIWPQQFGGIPRANALISVLYESGLFDVVKAIEVIGGVLLILNRFVPVALVMLLPISSVVFYNDAIIQLRWNRILYMGTGCLYLNIILLLAYLRYYLPMMKYKTDFGTLSDLKKLPSVFND